MVALAAKWPVEMFVSLSGVCMACGHGSIGTQGEHIECSDIRMGVKLTSALLLFI